jgi:hypothetical protein
MQESTHEERGRSPVGGLAGFVLPNDPLHETTREDET